MPILYQLNDQPILPDPREADDPDGLLAVGGDLSPVRLMRAYASGIFPWFNAEDPILWWSPPQRALILPGQERFSRRTLRALKNRPFEIRFDTCFPDVIQACQSVARPGQAGTWITDAVLEAYITLHELGYAHSVEAFRDGHLVGGLYGVSLGAMFCGESMFAHEDYSSRAAFQALCQRAWSWGFHFIDGQLPNSNLLGLGAAVEPRDRFLARLHRALDEPTRRGPWHPAG